MYRVLNITVDLNKGVRAKFSSYINKTRVSNIKECRREILMKISKKVVLNKNVGGNFFLKINKNVVANRRFFINLLLRANIHQLVRPSIIWYKKKFDCKLLQKINCQKKGEELENQKGRSSE